MHSIFTLDRSRQRATRTRRSPLLMALLALPLMLGLLGMNVPDTAQATPGALGTNATVDDPGNGGAPDEEQGATGGTEADSEAPRDGKGRPTEGGAADPLAEAEPMEVQWETTPTPPHSAAVSPRSVPIPDREAHESVITVRVGGDRVGEKKPQVAPLAGITLQLHDTNSKGWHAAPITEPWATCTSDADGDCSFVVPNTAPKEENQQRLFSIVQVPSAATAPGGGWYPNPVIRTGRDHVSNYDQQYEFLSPRRLVPGHTYTSGLDNYPALPNEKSTFMNMVPVLSGALPQRNSIGIWQNSRQNPELGCRVGLKVALVLDLSKSIDNPDPITKKSNLPNLKRAAQGFVQALSGTGSSVGVFTFSADAPSSVQATGANYPLTPIDDDGNVLKIQQHIGKYQTVLGTNWDQGIYQVEQDQNDFDVAIVVTDGLPTLFSKPAAGPTSVTRISEVEAAIFSANALKAKGTRMIAVGVGDIIKGSPVNLAAISGPQAFGPGVDVADADYFETDWESLTDRLGEIAQKTQCAAEITVKKEVRPYGQSEFIPARAGWNFDLDSGAHAAFESTGTTAVSSSTDASGSFTQTVHFLDEAQGSTDVSITEQLTAAQRADEWSLKAVSCVTNGGTAVTPTITNMGVTVPAAKDDRIVCTFQNEQLSKPSITLVKRGWATEDVSTIATPGSETAAEITKGSTLKDATQVSWSYDVTNTGETPISDLKLVDNRLAEGSVSCPANTLAPGATMRCTATGPVHITTD